MGGSVRARTAPVAALLAVTVLAALPASAASIAATLLADIAPAETGILVGVIVNGVEVGSVEVVRRDGELLLPLVEVVELIGAELEEADGAVAVSTPIGRVTLALDEVVRVDGVLMAPFELFEARLATGVAFDRQEFALLFDVPWSRPGEAPGAAAAAELGPADFTPPAATLATLQADLRAARESGRDVYQTSTVAEGRLASGWWRVRYEDDLDTSHRFEEYSWLRTSGRRQLLLGHQRLRLHPIFDSLELTGAQLAYTNVDLDSFSRSREARELLSRRMQSVTTVRGFGPPGGLAEIRIDGVPLDRRTIALNGTYEFTQVLLPSRQATRIEVYVYDRSNLLIPVAIVDETRRAFDLLMEDGAVVHQGGLGSQGNLADDQREVAGDGELAGFYQLRYGVSDRLTVEAAAQRVAGRDQLQAGVVARLGAGLVASLGAVASDEALGYDLELSGQWDRWWLQGRSYETEEGFRVASPDREFDHYLELGLDAGRRLDLSLIARRRDGPTGEADYLLPAVSWRPVDSMSVRIRPDLDGRYMGNLWWRIDRRSRLGVDVLEDLSTSAELSRDVGARSTVRLGADLRSGLPDRYSATYETDLDLAARTTLSAGALVADGELGYEARATIGIDPGFLVNVEIRDDPSLRGFGEDSGRRYFVGMSIDLGFAGGRIIPAHRGAVRDDRGAIAGVVRAAEDSAGRRRLDNVLVLVDGARGGRTDASGTFFAGRLAAGLHVVELDSENLPIELVPDRSRWLVEVAPGAVTRVDFTVHAEYGIAGRVTDAAGRALPGWTVAVLDSAGRVVGRATTDRFGLYRVDGMPTGVYQVGVLDDPTAETPETLATREIEIVDDFLFGQDLMLPFEVPAPPES